VLTVFVQHGLADGNDLGLGRQADRKDIMHPSWVDTLLKSGELKKYTPDTKISLQEIKQELNHTRQKGYCVLFHELAEGKGSISAPVFDRSRTPVAAISISASTHRLSQPQIEFELARAVMTTATKISGKLGYFPK